MSCLGNLIWIIFGGFINALAWLFAGVVWCITIVGIPVGMQCFKLASLQFAPFGKEVVTKNDSGVNIVLNIFWILFGGIELCIANLISAFLLCITIIGIPFAKQSLKLAKLALMPFGKEIITK
ncbi:YccF domain-containing protein [Clostridium sp. MB05]